MKLFKFSHALLPLMCSIMFLVSCQEEQTAPAPVIELSKDKVYVEAEGEELTILYSVKNEVEGQNIQISTEADWVTLNTDKVRVLGITVAKNEASEKRQATVVFSYPGAESVELSVSQSAWEDPISLEVLEVMDTKVRFSVNTLDDDFTWTGQIVDKDWFDGLGSDEAIFQKDYEYYLEEAQWADVTLQEYIAQILNKGSYSSLTFKGLDPQSDYVIYVYGMDEMGNRTSSIYSAEITTLDPYEGPLQFDITCAASGHVVSAQIIPCHEGVPFWADIMTMDDLMAAETESTEEGGKIKEYAQTLIDAQYQTWYEHGYVYDREEYAEYAAYDYEITDFVYEGYPETEYIVYAAKMDEEAYLVGDVAYEKITTGVVEPSDNVLTVTVGEATQTTLDLTITTTNDDPYMAVALEKSYVENCTTDSEIYAALVRWAGSTWNLEYYMTYGSITGRMTYLTPDADHMLFVFGYTGNTVTTEMQKFEFRTLPAGDPDDCEFTFNVTDIKTRSATVEVIPEDTSVEYYWDIFSADATEEDIIKKVESVKWDCYDPAEFRYYITYLDEKVTLTNLIPSASYKLAAIPLSYEEVNGEYELEYLGDAVFSDVFTMMEGKVADITISAGYEKYYDGDLLADANPDYYGQYRGYAYVPMKVSIEGEYERFRYSIFTYEEGLDDPEVYSDVFIVENLEKVGVDYDANFRVLWDTPYMIAAVAFDFDGNFSPIYREVINLNREGAGPVEDIIGSASSSSYSSGLSTLGMTRISEITKECHKSDASVKVFSKKEFEVKSAENDAKIQAIAAEAQREQAQMLKSSKENKKLRRFKMEK